jgi:hypothetical protein
VNVRDDSGTIVLAYRSFTSVTGLVAAVMAAIVILSGLAAAAFLITEGRYVPAAIAVLLSAAFAVIMAMLVPPANVTIYEGAHPALTIAQQSSLSIPSVTFLVSTADGQPLARIRKSVFSRLARNRWWILPTNDAPPLGHATEQPFLSAMVSKVWGKANVAIRYLDRPAGMIDRKADTLELDAAAPIDRRVAVALATIVLGAEP